MRGCSAVKLSQLLMGKIRTGFSPPLASSDGVASCRFRVLKLSALTPLRLQTDESKPISCSYKEKVKPFLLRPGMFLLARAGTYEGVGRCTLVRQYEPNLTFPDLMMSFSVDSRQVEPDFLEACLQSPQVRNYLSRRAVGTSASMVKINQQILLDLPLMLPSLERQREFLPLLALFRQAVSGSFQLLERLKQRFGLYEGLLNQTLFFVDQGHRPWSQRPMGELFHSHSETKRRGKWLMVSKQYGVGRRKISFPQECVPVRGKTIRSGDFVLSLRAAEGGIELAMQSGLLSAAYTVLRPQVGMVPYFFRFLFKSKFFINKILSSCGSGTRGDGKIDWQALSQVYIPYPSIAEQTEIAAFFLLLERQIELVRGNCAARVQQLLRFCEYLQERKFLDSTASQSSQRRASMAG